MADSTVGGLAAADPPWPGVASGAGIATSKGSAVGGGNGVGNASPPKRARTTSTFQAKGGRRSVKAYPLTETEMLTLGTVQGLSALLFALAGALAGFWISTRQAIAFVGKDTAKETVSYWQGMGDAAFWGAIFVAVIAAVLFGLSGFTVLRIKKETDHA